MRGWGRIAILIVGAGVTAGCIPVVPPPGGGGGTTTTTTTTTTTPPVPAADVTTQADLIRALGDEDYLRNMKTFMYTDHVPTLQTFDPSLDWGGRLQVYVGDAWASYGDTVCVSETSPSGTTFELAKVALGGNGGKYTGNSGYGCPPNDGSGANLVALGHNWEVQSAQADLQEGLVDEDNLRSANGTYAANTVTLKTNDLMLDWGGRITAVVGDASTAGDGASVCLAEASPDGTVFEIAKVATGADAGTYYGINGSGCPANDGVGANLKALGLTWADQAVQNDLTRGLTDEVHVRDDHGAYDSVVAGMKAVDSTLDWGGRLYLVVGDAVNAGDAATVCLAEASPAGKTFEIAEVAAGANAGTYYGKAGAGCPANDVSGANLKALGSSW